MPARHVVVDGSNIATEGRSLPSLKQLDEAVREYLIENPDDVVTVVVDATFGHRISPDERDLFEEAEGGGEIVSPPAGAIGRGDAFLLRVADRVGAVVLSNDSFQEFHGEYEWLFDKGRLIGGKPVPGVGWIFTPRTPVRGPKSRESVKEAKRKRHADRATEAQESGLDMAAERSRGYVGERKLQRAIAAAVEEAVEPAKGGRKRRRRRRGSEGLAEPLNEPLKFITFIAANQLGDEVEGTVEEFSSHGAFVSVDGARCYVPLSAMSTVAPRSAREVLRKGERRAFVVQAFDAMRRGIELALPGFAHPAGAPTAETIDAEIHHGEADGQLVPAEAVLTRTGAAELSTSEAPRPPLRSGPRIVPARWPSSRPVRRHRPPLRSGARIVAARWPSRLRLGLRNLQLRPKRRRPRQRPASGPLLVNWLLRNHLVLQRGNQPPSKRGPKGRQPRRSPRPLRTKPRRRLQRRGPRLPRRRKRRRRKRRRRHRPIGSRLGAVRPSEQRARRSPDRQRPVSRRRASPWPAGRWPASPRPANPRPIGPGPASPRPASPRGQQARGQQARGQQARGRSVRGQ